MATPRSRTSADLLCDALCVGLAVGLLEGTLYQIPQVHYFLTRQNIRLGPDRLWLPAAANLFWFGLAALPLALLHRRWPSRVTAARAIGVLAGLAALSLTMLFTRMHDVAHTLIAVGVGVQVSRLLEGRGEQVLRGLRRTLVPLLALGVIAAVGSTLVPRFREARMLAGTPAPPAGRPNVLLIILDTVRGFNLSLHGYHRATTPRLDRRAAEGATFDRAMTPSPWTLPSHGSVFTGQYPYALSTDFKTPLDGTHRTLAEEFTAQGYRTAGFVGNLPYGSRALGLGRGFLHYEDIPVTLPQMMLHSTLGRWLKANLLSPIRKRMGRHDLFDRRQGTAITDRFLAWSGATAGRPFFVFLNYYDAHHPYLPPAPFDRRFTPDSQPPYIPWDVESRREPFTPAMVSAARNAYDGAISFLDHELGRMFDTLAARGVLDHTIVIVTSDHGEHFGEHGLMAHGNSVYRPLLQVPLFIRFPERVPGGTRIAEPVTLRDLGATVFDLARLVPASPWPGGSLRAAWDTAYQGAPLSPVYAELRSGRRWRASLLDDGYQLYRDDQGKLALFHQGQDPNGEVNLLAGDTSTSTLTAIAARLTARMDSLVPPSSRLLASGPAEEPR
ncbi:MAG: sulfatase-like hydrolase/transferase [Gemmatimonadota bacterium]|nr:sulfatase-like hydrolase/transferase [Gemmatimonadota bacterium]